MAATDKTKPQMGGIGYAQAEGKQALVTATSSLIQLCTDSLTGFKNIEVSAPITCLAVGPLSDVLVVGENNFVKVSGTL